MKNKEKIKLEYSISNVKCKGLIVFLLLLCIVVKITDESYASKILLVYGASMCIVFRATLNEWHESLHEKGFSSGDNPTIIVVHKKYSECRKPISVENYIKGLIMPSILYIRFALLFGVVMIAFNDDVAFCNRFSINTNLYYVLIFTFLNPMIFGLTEFIFDIWVAAKLYYTTLNNANAYGVVTPDNLSYGYKLISKNKT